MKMIEKIKTDIDRPFLVWKFNFSNIFSKTYFKTQNRFWLLWTWVNMFKVEYNVWTKPGVAHMELQTFQVSHALRLTFYFNTEYTEIG